MTADVCKLRLGVDQIRKARLSNEKPSFLVRGYAKGVMKPWAIHLVNGFNNKVF